MNILIFCSNTVNGGTAKMFYELTSALQKSEPEHRVIGCVDTGNTVDIYNKIVGLKRVAAYTEEYICKGMYGGNLASRAAKRLMRKAKYFPVIKKNITSMRTLLRDGHIDAVVIHNGGYIGDELSNQMLEVAYLEQIRKRVYILHSCTTEQIILKARFLPYDWDVSKQATDIVTVSEFTRSRIKEISHISSPIKIIPNGLPDSKSIMSWEEKMKRLEFQSDKKNLLMIGNFLENKGQLELLKAMEKISRCIEDIHLTMIGNIYDENYYSRCVKFIKDKRLENYISIFQGIDNASQYAELFDLMAVPSVSNESFGLVSVEAMMNGVPVVAYNCGGISEVVEDGRDGYVVKTGDSIALAERIIELMNDGARREQMSWASRKDFEDKFSIDAMVKRYKRIIGI